MKLYQSGEIYNPVKPETLLEVEFAALVTKHREHLFPEFFAINYSQDLPSRTGDESRPHLVLIDRNYGGWWLVMIAVSQQSVMAVIRPRLKNMVQAVLLPDRIPALKALEPNLDETSTAQLLKHDPHQTFLLTNEIRDEWKTALSDLKIRMGVLEMFRSRKQRAQRSPRDHILRINGEQPEPPANIVSDCFFRTTTLLEIAQPAILAPYPAQFAALYKGQLVRLVKKPTSQGGVVVQGDQGSGVPYTPNGYKLSRRGDMTLEFIDVTVAAQGAIQ